jgi:hypothetical protein
VRTTTRRAWASRVSGPEFRATAVIVLPAELTNVLLALSGYRFVHLLPIWRRCLLPQNLKLRANPKRSDVI